MRNYELYLDESGKFIEEENAKSPSLIGGILVKKGDLSMEKAQKLMKTIIDRVDKNYVHINDLVQKDKKTAGKVAVELIEELIKIPANIVIFENNELLDFKDDKQLYLNIIAEGIINLLEKLSLEKADTVELNVIAAVRRDLKEDDEKAIIEMEEYSTKIKERIYIKFAEKSIFLSKNCKINFELSSARKNFKLMLADVVCNTRLTRNSSKFDDEQRERIEKRFNSSKYIFNVFRTDLQKKLSNYLLQNNIVDSIFLINEIDNEKDKKELINLIVNNINTMPISNLRIQLELLSLKIRSLIEVHRNLFICEKLLLNLQENIIEKIKIKDFVINKLKLDISLYLLTIYTHLGNNIKSREQIDISMNELKLISGSWDFFEYYYILKIREAIYYNICFNHEKTIEILTVAIEKYEKILATIETIEELKSVKSDMLAKVFGTRLQAYIDLITPNINEETKKIYYEKAVVDSNYAISHFISKLDKSRQYQYRSMLELSVGNIKEAIKYLMQVLDLNMIDFEKFVEKLSNITDFSKNFILVNYFEIMQYAMNHNEIPIAKQMYESFEKNSNLFKEYALEHEKSALFENVSDFKATHPFESIYWCLAKYFKHTNKYLANIYYNKAIEICEEIDEIAVYVLQLAIIADKLTISSNIKEDRKELIQKYKLIIEEEKFFDIHNFLNKFEDEFIILEISEDVNEIKEACKLISEGIKV